MSPSESIYLTYHIATGCTNIPPGKVSVQAAKFGGVRLLEKRANDPGAAEEDRQLRGV